jgi:hypothetical protein
MATQRKILMHEGSVALVEEKIYVVEPELTIHTAYSVTSAREALNLSFDTLGAAQKYFATEVVRCRSFPR